MVLYRRALGASQLVIFQNEDDRRDFRRMRMLPAHKPSIVVNGSGVDLDHYIAQPVPEEVSFLMIARYLRDKGIREFGAAAARLKAEFPQVRVKLAGWLDEAPDAISQAELDAIVAGGVEDLGRLPDVRPAIAQASVYVLPSYREGTPANGARGDGDRPRRDHHRRARLPKHGCRGRERLPRPGGRCRGALSGDAKVRRGARSGDRRWAPPRYGWCARKFDVNAVNAAILEGHGALGNPSP
jgi:hypothetical protein